MSPAPIRMPSSANTTPLSGISAANSHQISCACSTTRGSSVNACGRTSVEREQHEAEAGADDGRPQDHPRGRRARPRGVARAEQAADHHLRGDRQRVEDEREEDEELERDLVRGQRGGADPGQHGGGDQERAEQRAGADRDLGPDPDQRAHAREQRRLEARRGAAPATKARPMPACAITVPHAEPARPQPKP